MLFSATMPIALLELAYSEILRDPEHIEVGSQSVPPATVSQSVYLVRSDLKTDLLLGLLREEEMESVMVFVRTRRRADLLVKRLQRERMNVTCIHGARTAGRAGESAGQLPAALRASAGRDRCGRSRPTRGGGYPCRELRYPRHGGRLPQPHRPHRAGGGIRRCPHFGEQGGRLRSRQYRAHSGPAASPGSSGRPHGVGASAPDSRTERLALASSTPGATVCPGSSQVSKGRVVPDVASAVPRPGARSGS